MKCAKELYWNPFAAVLRITRKWLSLWFSLSLSLSLSLFLSLAPFLMWFSELHAIMKTARCPQTGIISHTFLRFYNFIHSTRCKCILKYRATFPQSECYTEKKCFNYTNKRIQQEWHFGEDKQNFFCLGCKIDRVMIIKIIFRSHQNPISIGLF